MKIILGARLLLNSLFTLNSVIRSKKKTENVMIIEYKPKIFIPFKKIRGNLNKTYHI